MNEFISLHDIGNIFVDSSEGYGKRTENIQAGQHFPD